MSSHFLHYLEELERPISMVIENGKGFTVYNHMLLPACLSVEDDYHHLKKKYRFGMYLVKDKLKLMAKIVLSF